VKKIRDVIIIGCGPAGASAAIQLKRMGFEPLVFEKNEIGGLSANANLIENYLGYPGGINGVRFCSLLKKQILNHKIEVRFEEIKTAEFNAGNFIVRSDNGNYNSKYLIDATGTEPVIPNDIVIEEKVRGKVFFEIKNILKLRNKEIAVLGGGDAAFDYSLNLSKNNNVSIYNRSNNFKCLDLLFNRAKKNRNISINKNYILRSISGYGNKAILNFKANQKKEKSVNADYIIIAFGRSPAKDYGIINKKFFCIGDKINGNFRQISLSVGDGVKTAMRIYKSENE